MRTSELTASVGMRTRVLRDLVSAERLLPEWSDLWSRCPDATTFQRPQWLLAWMQSFDPSQPWLIEVRRNDRLVGIAPLLIYQSGSEKILALMGGGISDYLDVLVDPDFADATLGIFWNQVNQEPEWTTLDLTDLRCTSPLLHQWPNDWNFTKTVHDVCSGLALPSKVEKLKTVLPFRLVRNLRTAGNRLRRAGDVQIEIATRETLTIFLESLFHLHSQRWSQVGQSGVLHETVIQSFHKRVASDLLDRGVLRLYALRLNGRIIASVYTLCERDTVCCYVQGFDPDYAHFSPGAQLLGAVITDATREGKRRVDFLRGSEPYKHHWGASEVPTFRIQARKRTQLEAISNAA